MMQASRPLCRGTASRLWAPSSRSLTSVSPALSSIAGSGLNTNIKSCSPLSAKRFNASLSNAPAPTLDFDPHAVTAMDKQTPPEPGADFNVVIVGA